MDLGLIPSRVTRHFASIILVQQESAMDEIKELEAKLAESEKKTDSIRAELIAVVREKHKQFLIQFLKLRKFPYRVGFRSVHPNAHALIELEVYDGSIAGEELEKLLRESNVKDLPNSVKIWECRPVEPFYIPEV